MEPSRRDRCLDDPWARIAGSLDRSKGLQTGAIPLHHREPTDVDLNALWDQLSRRQSWRTIPNEYLLLRQAGPRG